MHLVSSAARQSTQSPEVAHQPVRARSTCLSACLGALLAVASPRRPSLLRYYALGGKKVHQGMFATAAEAALCVARCKQNPP